MRNITEAQRAASPDGFGIEVDISPLTLHETGVLHFEVDAGVNGHWRIGQCYTLAALGNNFLRGFRSGYEERLSAAEHYARTLEAEAARIRDYAADDSNF